MPLPSPGTPRAVQGGSGGRGDRAGRCDAAFPLAASPGASLPSAQNGWLAGRDRRQRALCVRCESGTLAIIRTREVPGAGVVMIPA